MASQRNELKAGAVLSYLSIFVNIAAGLIFTPWMVAQIGQSDYGIYTLANSLITLFLIDFGLSSATSKFVSQYRAEGNQEKLNQYLGAIYKLYLIISAVILVGLTIIYFFLDSIYVNLTTEELEKFKVVYVISALFAVVNFPCVTFNGILNAFEQFVLLKTADIVYRISFVAATAIALYLGYGLYALVTVHAVVGLLVIALKFVVIRKKTPVRVDFKHNSRGLYRQIFTFSVWVTISGIAQRATFNFTPTVLGMTVKNAAVAISVFGIVTTIESYAYLIPGAINGMFMPRISALYVKNDIAGLNRLMDQVGRFQFAVNGLIAAGFVVVGQGFIQLWVGEAYALAYGGILLTIIPGVFYNSLQIANTTLIVSNKIKYKAIVDCAMAVVNVGLAFLLAPVWGVTGACAAIFVAYTLRVAALSAIYKKVLPIDMRGFVKNCFLKMSVPVLLTIGAGMVMNMLITQLNWWTLILEAGVVTAVYGVLVYLIAMTADERKRLSRIWRR